MEIEILHKLSQIYSRSLRYCIAFSLIASLTFPAPLLISTAWAADVSVQGNSTILENLGRAVQSPDARSNNLPPLQQKQERPNLLMPDMGDPGGNALSPLEERRMGERIMREIRPDPDYSDDLPITDFLNEMERRLLQAAKKLQLGGANNQGSAAYNYEIFLVKDPSINAFSLPGGFIGFHSGLIVAA